MIICVTSEGSSLNSNIDSRFGRAKYFIFYNTDDSKFESVENENVMGSGGVGVKSGQFVATKQARVVITGNIGPNASKTLQSAGINVVLNASGSVEDVIENYKSGNLKSSDVPNAQEKSGLNNE